MRPRDRAGLSNLILYTDESGCFLAATRRRLDPVIYHP